MSIGATLQRWRSMRWSRLAVMAALAVLGVCIWLTISFKGHKAVYSADSAALRLAVSIAGSTMRADMYAHAVGGLNGFSEQEKNSESGSVGVDFKYVSNSGALFLANREYGVLLVAEPTTVGTKLTWKCTGFPIDISALACDQVKLLQDPLQSSRKSGPGSN